MNTLVSIITPSFNQAKYIEDTIRSVHNQNYRPIEHIIVDGGSTDNTIEILKKYQSESSEFQCKWVSEEDNGQANAINKGLRLARGQIIGWINSDDVYFSKFVIKQVVREFQKYPEIDVIHGNVAKIGENNLIRFFWCIPEFDYERMYFDGKISQPTVFFRREIFNHHTVRENIMALDYELWLQIGQSHKFKHLDFVMAADREQPNRISFTKKEDLQKSHLQVRDEYFHQPPFLKTSWYRISSFPFRFLLRLKGLIQLIKWMENPNWKKEMAFDGFIDSKWHAVYRQMFQRVGKL